MRERLPFLEPGQISTSEKNRPGLSGSTMARRGGPHWELPEFCDCQAKMPVFFAMGNGSRNLTVSEAVLPPPMKQNKPKRFCAHSKKIQMNGWEAIPRGCPFQNKTRN